MDKYEYNLKLEEITRLVDQGYYEDAMDIVDTIDWRRVRNVRTLCMVSEIYEENGRLEDSKNLLLRAYRKSQAVRSILFRLTEISVKLRDFDDAAEFYSEFVNVAPNDNSRYLLKYMIYRGRGAAIEDQIEILEEYNQKEYTEKYAYELAKLYYRADQKMKCVDACDDLVLWFRQGKYVIRALELKQKITELTPVQQAIYDNRNEATMPKAEMVETVAPDLEKAILENMPESKKEVLTDDVISVTEKEIAQSVAEHAAANAREEEESRIQSYESNVPEIHTYEPEEETQDTGKDPIDIPAPAKPQKTGKDYGFNTADLQAELAKSMRDIVAGIQRKPDDSDIIEPVNDVTEREEEMPVQESIAEPKTNNIDDILLSMSAAQKEAAIAAVFHTNQKKESEAVEESEEIKEPEPVAEAKVEEIKEPEPVAEAKVEGIKELEPVVEAKVEEVKEPEPVVEAKVEEVKEPEPVVEAKVEEVKEPEPVVEAKVEEVKEPEPVVAEPIRETVAEDFGKTKNISKAIEEEPVPAPEPERIPTDLTEEQKYTFSYFSTVGGLRQQIASALYMVMKKMNTMDQTSRTGNLIIIGAEGSGKSTLGIRFAKTISAEKGEESAKIAKIYAEDFNKKDIPSTVAKIAGGTLIIEEAGDLDDAVVEQLSKAMEFRTDALLVILEDEKKYLKELFDKHPGFAEKFTNEIVIPVFTNDELVEFGRTYAYDEDYTIDENAVAALYERIGELQEDGRPVTVIDVKEIVDHAIKQSEKIGFRKLGMVLSKKRYDKDDRVILYEKDFR